MNIFYVYALHKRRTLFYTEIRIFVHVNPRFKRKKNIQRGPLATHLTEATLANLSSSC